MIREYITCTELKKNFKKYSELAKEKPIFITRYGKSTYVLLGIKLYNILKEE